jgi:hypothetical protein
MFGQNIFKFHKTNFIENITISEEIPTDLLLYEHLNYFDKDGYKLTTLERSIHNYFEIPVNYFSVCDTWIQQNDRQHICLDHNLIYHRYSYEGKARLQIEKLCSKRPELRKLLAIKNKYGITFSVDYIDDNNYFELINIEYDSRNYDEIHVAASKLSTLILNTDFNQLATELIDEKNKWYKLNQYDQNNYKAKKIGISKAFENKKAVSGRLVSI